MMNNLKASQQLNAIYALSHQELFELVKIMAFKTADLCNLLQNGCPLKDEDRISQALDFAESGIVEAIEEAKSNWRPISSQESIYGLH